MTPAPDSWNWPRAAWLLLLAGTLLRLVCAATFPLLEAEAYYWRWHLDPAWGYWDHPPLVAALVGASTAVAGDSALGVRLGSVLLGTAATGLLYEFCRRVVRARAALACLAFVTVAPFWMPFGIVVTPDAPLLACWMLALFLFREAWRRDGTVWWLGTGLAAGLAILAKYNGFQLPLVFAVFLLSTPQGRDRLRSPAPWMGVAVALLIALPNLAWNLGHGGSAVAIPFREGLEFSRAPLHLLALVLLPFAVLTPLVAWAWLRRTWSGLRRGRWYEDDDFRLLCCAAGVPLVVFALVSVVTLVHAHWIATAVIAATPLAFEGLDDRTGAREGASPRTVRAGLVVAVALTALILAAPAFAARFATRPGRHERPGPLARLALEFSGWEALGERIDAELTARDPAGRAFLATKTFHMAGKVQWLTGMRYEVLPFHAGRAGQYALWTEPAAFAGRDALFVVKSDGRPTGKRIVRAFESVQRIKPVKVELEGRPTRRFELYWCRGFLGREVGRSSDDAGAAGRRGD